ncbi:MAG: histidine kinase [Bacteroidales bacterium]|nr:histidine kinase [Bacteroidales bacterium]
MKKPAVFLSLIQQYSKAFAWLSIYAICYFIASLHQETHTAFILTSETVLPMLSAWALLYYLIIPRLLHKHPWWFFLCCLGILFLFSVLATEVDSYFYLKLYAEGKLVLPPKVEQRFLAGESPREFLHTKYVFLLLTTIATTTVAWLLDEHKRISQQTKENRTQLELKYLRAQINPHFLFNSLNCIYSLTLMQDEKAPDSVLKLSEMLRYITDDCKADTVLLQKEIDYIHNYIGFQLIRMENQPDITFTTSLENPSVMLPPMIFQPMVENCFKHSRIVDHPDGYIHLDLRQEGKQITFTAENSIPELEFKTKDSERSGIGLNNVQQRLNLIFGDKCSFRKTETKHKYRIELCITC